MRLRRPARRKLASLVVLVLLVAPLLVTPRVATGPAVAATPRATSPSELAAACPDPVPLGGFADVERTDTHARAIDCLVAYAITQGVEPARYAPARSVTRAQMATFLVRLLRVAGAEAEALSIGRFGDVEGVHAEAIEALAALGIAQGITATTFAPAATVTRAQMATFLDRTLRHLDVPLPGADDPGALPFADVAAGDTHAAAIARLAAAGVVAGRTATSYDPAAAVTREQMASFLMRSTDLLVRAELAHPPYVAQPVVVAEDTVVLDAAQRAALLEVDADAGEATLVFDTPPVGIAAGDVLVSAPAPAAPDGLLVRVVEVDGVQVLAEPAGLTDALASGSGALTTTLEAGDVAEERYAPAGLRVRSLPGQEALSLTFGDVEVAPGVTATGSLSLELTSTLEIDIARRRLVQPYLVRFAATSTLEQRASLELRAERGASFEHEQLVYAAGFAPLTVMVGPVPVVVTPSLEVRLAAGGEVTASLGYAVEQTSSATLGAIYQPASGWTPVAGWDAGFDHRLDEVLKARTGVVAGIVPAVALYGVIDVSSPVWVGAELEAGRDRDPVWSLGAFVEADAAIGVTLPLVEGLPSYRRTILARDWILAEAERAYPSDAEGVANAFYAAFLDRDADEARRFTRAQRPDAYDDLLARWTSDSVQQFLGDRVTCGDPEPDPDPGRELRFCHFTTGVTPSDVMVLDRDGDGRWVVLGVGLGEAYPHIWGASPGDPDIVELCVTGSAPLPLRSWESPQAAVMAELAPGSCGIAGIREDWMLETDEWWNVRVDGLVGFVARDRVEPVGGAAGFSDDELLAAVGCPRQPCLVEQSLAYEHPQLGPVTLVFRTADTYWGTLLAVDDDLRVVWRLGDLGFSVGELRTDVLGHAFVGHSAGGSGYRMLALVPRGGGFTVTELGTQNYGGIWDSTGDGRLELHVSVGMPDMCHSCPPARFAVHAWDGVAYTRVGEIDAGPWIEDS